MNPMIAYRFFSRPLALAPEAANAIAQAAQYLDVYTPNDKADERPYDLVNGVAIVSIRGVLMHSQTMMGWLLGGESTYSGIWNSFSAAMDDPKANAVALHIESPGGEVDGCFELADAMYAMRDQKPIVAICDPYAYSAAYALASAAHAVYVPRTGGAGSIGVIAMHAEQSKMLADMGVTVTIIRSASRKDEFGPYAPLSADAKARLQDDVDAMGSMFVDLVARNRGVSTAHIRSTNGGTFMGASAVENRLADGIASPTEVFSLMMARTAKELR